MRLIPPLIFDIGAAALVLFSGVAGAAAQSGAVAVGPQVIASGTGARAVEYLDRPARLAIENVSLPEALVELRRRAGVPLVFSEDLLPKGLQVSCTCASLSVREALDRLLSGTKLQYSRVRTQVLIEPTPPITNMLATPAEPIRPVSTLSPMLGSLPGARSRHQGTIGGTVTAANTMRPLAGAQISVVGTERGGLTNSAGEFLIMNVPVGPQTVRAQIIGYRSEEEAVIVAEGQAVTVDFELTESAIALDEIVVTGTAGGARQRELGVSVAQIDAGNIDRAAVTSVADVLQGRATGTTILVSSGMVGAGSKIVLRGNGSVVASNEPLIYVDGVRMDNSPIGGDFYVGQAARPLDDINPENIARIEVIKGPAATTLYGSEAAGGVIQIFTKNGVEGETAWTLSTSQGILNLGHVGPEGDPSGLNLNDCRIQDPPDPTCPASGSWLRNGHIQEYNLSVRGGGDEVTYFASGHFDRQEGVIAPQQARASGMRGNFTFSPSEELSISFNNSYSHRKIRWIPDGDALESFMLNALRGGKGYTPGNQDGLILDGLTLISRIDHFMTGATVRWTPGNGLRQRLTLGMDWSASAFSEEVPLGYWEDPLGYRESRQEHNRRLTFDYVGSWDLDLGNVGFLSRTTLFDGMGSSFSWGAQFYNDYDGDLRASAKSSPPQGIS